MKFRPQRVNTDISNRNITAEMARDAINMRLMEVPDDNQLGVQTCAGNTLVQAHGLAGLTCCVGVWNLLDNSGIIYALWNENGDHGLWVYTDTVQQVFYQTSTLNFKQDCFPNELGSYVKDYSVSIKEIDGLVYWQDEYNFPKVVDWKKSVDGFYTNTMLLDWEISRIWRKPAFELGGQYSVGNTPTDLKNSSATAFPNVPLRGNQWAYSYVRDDNTESRLSPYSPVIWSVNVDFYVPQYEAENFLQLGNRIKAVNFYFRVGNTELGWQLYKTLPNSNYNTSLGFSTLLINVPNQNNVVGAAPIFDIGAQVFEATPLLVRDTALSQNRLFDANYVEGYDAWGNLDFTLTEVTNAPSYVTFHPETTYKIGVTLIDLWGRRVGVEKFKEYRSTAQYDTGTGKTFVSAFDSTIAPFFTNDTLYGSRRLNLAFTGTLPSWCATVEVQITRNRSISSFFRTQALLWQWANANSTDVFGSGYTTPIMAQGTVPSKKGVYRGIAFELRSGEGLNFSTENETYVRILGVNVRNVSGGSGIFSRINSSLNLNDPQYATPFPVYFKVVGVLGSKVLCETTVEQFDMFGFIFDTGANNQQPYQSSSWYIEVVTFASGVSDLFYTTSQGQFLAANVVGSTVPIFGDCFVKKQERSFEGGILSNMYALDTTGADVGNFDLLQTPIFTAVPFTTQMVSISQSLVNPFSQYWDYNQGSVNTIIADERQVRKSGYIRWSGTYLLGTQLNNLSLASALNEAPMPVELGAINGLMLAFGPQVSNTVLLAWCHNGVASNYLSQAQTVDTAGNSLFIDTSRVLGTTRTLVGAFGSMFLKHLVPSKIGSGYAYSNQFLDLIRYSGDGLTPLGSTHGFYIAIRDHISPELSAIGFDPYYEEVVFSGGGGNGLAWNEPQKSYQGKRTWQNVDRFWNYQQLTMVSFKNGNLYTHEYNNGTNVFYGDPFDSQLTIIANQEVGQLKTWNMVGIDGNLIGPVALTTDQGQTTDIQLAEFIDRKGYYYASIKNDTSNGGDKWDGELMESKVLTAVFEIDASNQKKINFVEISGNLSIVQ